MDYLFQILLSDDLNLMAVAQLLEWNLSRQNHQNYPKNFTIVCCFTFVMSVFFHLKAPSQLYSLKFILIFYIHQRSPISPIPHCSLPGYVPFPTTFIGVPLPKAAQVPG